ncbi:MAG TPA: hypothetical protein VF393_00020 [archaeon]
MVYEGLLHSTTPSAREELSPGLKSMGALLLISPWIPFAGDIVPIVAGVESFKLSTFLVILFVAKAIKGTAIVLFLSFFVQLLNFYI